MPINYCMASNMLLYLMPYLFIHLINLIIMSTKVKQVTPFEMALKQAEAGQLRTPSVNFEGNPVDYFLYQLHTHHFNLKIMAKGLKFRGISFTQIKNYYGLKGKSAKDCLPDMEAIIAKYKQQSTKN